MRFLFYNSVHISYSSGPEVWIMEVLPRLVTEGHSVTLLMTRYKQTPLGSEFKNTLASAGVRVVELPYCRIPLSGSAIPLRIPRVVLEKHDFIYFFNGYAFQDLIAFCFGKLARASIVYGMHAPASTTYWAHNLYQRVMSRLLIAKAYYVHVLNSKDLEIYTTINPNTGVVPYGVDHRYFHPRTPVPVTAVPSLVTITYVGRLDPQKNIPLMLRVMGLILDKYDSVVFNIAGDGEMLTDVLEFVSGHSNCKYLGRLGKQDIGDLLRSSQAFITLSRFETFCVAILEAAASGCAVITTPTYGMATDYDFRFTIVPADSPVRTIVSAIEEVIELVVKDPRSYITQVNANSLHASLFTWDHVVQALVEVCERGFPDY